MLVLRSLVYNVLFYLNLSILLLVALATFVLPRWGIIRMAKLWGQTSIWLLRVVVGTRVEYRGLDRVPAGGLLVASKHQSIFETFTLMAFFADPAFILKHELRWIPVFGWLTVKAGMIPVRRGGSTALSEMNRRAAAEAASGRQIIIFPEGTRRPAGAEPAYKLGIAHLYKSLDKPCLPVALNSGLFWPRRSFIRHPGTIVIEFLDPIAPGLERDAFLSLLQDRIERATAALIDEAREGSGYTGPAGI